MTDIPDNELHLEQDGNTTNDTPAESNDMHEAIWTVSAVLIGLFLLHNFITPAVFRGGSDWLMALAIGICIGEVNLIATWAVLAPGAIVVRLPWSALLGMLMWYALMLGNRATSSMSLSDAMLLGTILLGGVLAAQVPLWIAKKAFRWRLIHESRQVAQSCHDDRQFEIRHLLLGTALLAVALSPLRLVLPPGAFNGIPVEGESLIAIATVTMGNLIMTVPCVWGALFASSSVVRLFLVWLVYCAVVTLGEFTAMAVLVRLPTGMSWADIRLVVLIYYTVNVTQCAVVFGTLRVYRALGFRLVRVPACPTET